MDKMCGIFGITVSEFWDGPPQKPEVKTEPDETLTDLLSRLDQEELVLVTKIAERFQKQKCESYSGELIDCILQFYENFDNGKKDSFMKIVKKMVKDIITKA